MADGCEMMLRRTRVMQTMAQENKGLFKTVKDWIQKWTKTIRDAFRGVSEVHEEARAVAEMETERLEKLVELWDRGLIEASERAQKSPAKEGGAVKYSFDGGNARYDFTKSFVEQIDDWKRGLFPQRDSLLLGATPQIWRKVGFNALPVTINQTHIDYALNGTKDADHFIGEEITKDLPNLIQRPVAIIQSQSDPRRGVVIVRKEHNGKKIIAAVEVDGFARLNNQRIDSNAITSVYASTNALNMMRSAIQHTSNGQNELYYWNKREAVALMQGAGLRVPRGLPQDGFVHSIRDQGSNVNTRISSVTDSQQFKRWFGKSKVVNNDGTPKVVYHQTGADFTVFSTAKPGAGLNDSETPNGIFFKENDHDIGLNGKKQMPVYLSIQNPLHFENRAEANAWYQKNIPGYKKLQAKVNEFAADYNAKMDALNRRIFEAFANDDLALVEDLEAEEDRVTDEEAKKDAALRGQLRTLLDKYFIENDSGYDGIELDFDGRRFIDGKREDVHTYIVFKNTQVKSATDNIGTFDSNNPDIRYQERDALPDDRALLMAAEARGQNAEALEKYQKKVKALEALQRKLGRQREALAEAKEERIAAAPEGPRNGKTEERIATGASALAMTERESRKALEGKIQKTEASILRAEKVLDEMEPRTGKRAGSGLPARFSYSAQPQRAVSMGMICFFRDMTPGRNN